MGRTAQTVQKVSQLVLEAASDASRFNMTSYVLKGDQDALADIELQLEELGVRSVTFAGRGNVAIVLDAVDNQLIRLSAPGAKETRFDLPEILQPIMSFTTEAGYTVEVMPRVRTGEGVVTHEHLDALRISLACKGYVFDDVKIENVGLLADGTPVVLDGGAVITEEAYRTRMQEFRAAAEEAPSISNRNYIERLDAQVANYNSMQQNYEPLPHRYEGAQERHLETLGLEKGSISGVVDAKELGKLKAELGETNMLPVALESGFYPSQLPSQLQDVLVARGLMKERDTQHSGGYTQGITTARSQTTYSGYNGGH